MVLKVIDLFTNSHNMFPRINNDLEQDLPKYKAFFVGILLSLPLAAASEELGNAEKGQANFGKCASCHQIGKGATHRVGPHLNKIFGRRAGSEEDFKRYSKGLKRAGQEGLFWDFDTLDAFLENPKSLVSDTRMSFSGIKNPSDRADIIAYMRIFSDDPSNIPEAAPTAIAPEVSLSAETLAIVGDRDYGEYLSSECLTCHQTNGSDQGIPAITGWPEPDFVVAMHAYKEKVRNHPVMQMMAGRLSDEEIAALAAYFGELQ